MVVARGDVSLTDDGTLDEMLDGMADNSRSFIFNLTDFFVHRHGIDIVYKLATTPGELEGVDIAAVGIEAANGNYKAGCLQQCLGGGPVSSLDDLYTAAEAGQPTFVALLSDVATKVGPGVVVKLPPAGHELKGRGRASDKARDDYSDRNPGPGIGWLFDILRGALVCATDHDLKETLGVITADPRVKAVLNTCHSSEYDVPYAI